jgi:membrane protein implicated in regulation of membrane protease activity
MRDVHGTSFAYGLWLGAALSSLPALALTPWPFCVFIGLFGIVSCCMAWGAWRRIPRTDGVSETAAEAQLAGNANVGKSGAEGGKA